MHLSHKSDYILKKLLLLLLLTPFILFAKHNIAIQVLGSGGPEMGDKRASSAYSQ